MTDPLTAAGDAGPDIWDWGDSATDPTTGGAPITPLYPRTPWDPDGVGIAPPRTPRLLPIGAHAAAPVLSESVEPDRVRALRPTDLRMRNWRLRIPQDAEPVRYAPRRDGMQRKHWWEEALTWEHPITGEVRRCPAQPIGPWVDPWHMNTRELTSELARRVCTCGAATWPGGSLCVCAHDVTGWTQYDDIWQDPYLTAGVTSVVTTNKSATVRPRTLPAQHPMSTWRSRFRDRLWRWTHPILAKENR